MNMNSRPTTVLIANGVVDIAAHDAYHLAEKARFRQKRIQTHPDRTGRTSSRGFIAVQRAYTRWCSIERQWYARYGLTPPLGPVIQPTSSVADVREVPRPKALPGQQTRLVAASYRNSVDQKLLFLLKDGRPRTVAEILQALPHVRREHLYSGFSRLRKRGAHIVLEKTATESWYSLRSFDPSLVAGRHRLTHRVMELLANGEWWSFATLRHTLGLTAQYQLSNTIRSLRQQGLKFETKHLGRHCFAIRFRYDENTDWIQNDTPRRIPPVGQRACDRLLTVMSDGRWYSMADLIEHMGAPPNTTKSSLVKIQRLGALIERTVSDGRKHYRLVNRQEKAS